MEALDGCECEKVRKAAGGQRVRAGVVVFELVGVAVCDVKVLWVNGLA